MLLQNYVFVSKSFSTSSNVLPWRAQIKQHQLAAQISALLLQRRNWVPLLETLDLSSYSNPSLILRVLRKIETNPRISLSFFNWVKTRLGFEADLKSHCHIIHVLVGSGDFHPARPVWDSLAKAHSASRIADSMIRASKGSDSCHSSTLSFVVERYSHDGLSIEGLEVFRKMRICGLTPSVGACNALLDALQRKDEITLAWCFYGAMIRAHVSEDRATWSLIAQILSKGGKFDRIVALLDLGIYSSVMYNVVIDHYSKNGDFGAAFERLAEMCDRRVEAGFGTYSSILDGACLHRDVNVIEKTIGEMIEKGFLSSSPLLGYDSVIQKLSDLGKVHAAKMFFEKARENEVKLLNATYGCLLRAMSKHSRETLKRKRGSRSLLKNLSADERRDQIASLNAEIEGLFSYYREMMDQKLALDLSSAECGSNNGAIACCLEESASPLSKLVEGVYGKLKESNAGGGGLTVASVKSGVVFVGQRVMYGVPNADADVLEDDSHSSLWCWETRELKLLPKSVHGLIKIRRTCRRKIHERLCAVSAMVNALEKSEHDPDSELDMLKALEKLRKALNETDVRLLVDSMLQKTCADMAEKEAKLDHKAYIKQLERNKREVEREQKRMDRELQKEKLKAEKKLKRLQEEAEKEEKRCEREELELKKQLKKQEEAKKDQRRREKEEAELKKQLALQKQASMMERFLKRSKTTSPVLDDRSSPGLPLSSKAREWIHESVACLMDSALSSNQEITISQIWKSHLSSWRCLGQSIRSNQEQHWGIRRKPKTEIFKELKLTTSNSVKGVAQDDELNLEKLVSGWKERISDDMSICKAGDKSLGMRKCVRRKQLLQFDKSHRPAFYGIWPAKSEAVGPRHPFRKDPELDYDVDSDEEWEEEDPGESLSDCDKDDEESLDEGCSKADEDESEDGFFVPDGYLSENEGVQVDKMETDIPVEGMTSSSEQDSEHVVFSAFLQQQKHLHNVTEHALRKNQPFIVTNLSHEKSTQKMAGEVSAAQRLEQMCLEALSMLILPGAKLPECLADNILDEDEEDCPTNSKSCSTPVMHTVDVPDSELPTIVSSIQSCSQGINKVVDSLQQKLPAISKTLLRNKVREISDFVDNRWQVKKEILDKLGLPVSPESSSGRAKSRAAFFSKRCLPPAGGRGERR